jgi:hypothetical protein
VQGWSAVVIQRVVRGFLTRGGRSGGAAGVAGALRIRRGLSTDTLRLAERFLARRGDLWAFLQAVDADVLRVHRAWHEVCVHFCSFVLMHIAFIVFLKVFCMDNHIGWLISSNMYLYL